MCRIGSPIQPSSTYVRRAQDYGLVQQCAGQVAFSAQAGVGNADGPFCGCADLDGSGTVDEIDIQIFQALVTGP